MTKIKLGEVVNFYDGYPFSKLEQQDKGDFNYIKITNFSSGEIILDQNKINKPVKYREENILNGNEIIVAMSGSTGKVAFNTYKNILVNQRIAILRAKEDKVIPKYLRHLLVNSNFETYCNKLGTGLQKNISKETIANYEFNLPSLKVQNEIVEILDKFTELEAALEAELEARTKQYEYYRNKLLNFSNGSVGVPRIDKMLAEMCPEGIDQYTLGSIADYTNGKGHEKDVSDVGSYTLITSKFISTDGQIKRMCMNRFLPIDKGEIAMVLSDLPNGKALAKCFLVEEDGHYTVNQRICKLKPNLDIVRPRFLYYILNRNKGLLSYDSKVDQTNLTRSQVENLVLHIPTLEIQDEIIRILDNFSEYVSSISQGLPAEITARRKQYEYYRNKLLTF